MPAPIQQDSRFHVEFQSVPFETGHHISGSFCLDIPLAASPDQLEQQIEIAGQQFKRHAYQHALQLADADVVRLAQVANPDLHKHGSAPFTFKTRFGSVQCLRYRLRNKKTGKALTPSAVAWNTSQHSRITNGLKEAACDAVQESSYRKSTRQLTEAACEDKLLSTTTVWNIKQEKGRQLEKEQEQWLDNPDTLPLVSVPNASPKRIAKDTLQVQIDEVVTNSREKGQKVNTTYTATVETDGGQRFYLAAKSSLLLFWLLFVYLIRLGLFNGKSLEVISDGATWITKGLREILGVECVRVLCWYHLSKRVYESLSELGCSKQRRQELEHQVLGCLWRGHVAEASWILWGVRSSARTSERIEMLLRYLWHKREMIVNDERAERYRMACGEYAGRKMERCLCFATL